MTRRRFLLLLSALTGLTFTTQAMPAQQTPFFDDGSAFAD
jgi:hypothetical protein